MTVTYEGIQRMLLRLNKGGRAMTYRPRPESGYHADGGALMTAAPPPPPTRIPLATYDTGWKDAIEVARDFGKRHDAEPIQPLILVAFEEGEDAERKEYWLSRGEALALAQALVAVSEVPVPHGR